MHLQAWSTRLAWPVVAIVLCLMALGWLAIARSQELSGGSARYLYRQLIWSALCVTVMLAATIPSYRALARWSYVLLALALLLLVAVYWFPPINGARRWIRFGPLGLQPSEFAKVACVLGLARYLMYRETTRNFRGLLVPLGLVLIPVLLILKEPDLGTSLVFLPVLFAMLIAAGARTSHLALLVALAVAVMPVLWTQMSREQKSRVTALAEQTRADQRPTEDGYHLHQARQTLALGGWRGSLWAGEVTSDRNVYKVPEAHTDSIAILLGERLGLWGLATLMTLFWLLAWRLLVIARATREPFGRLVAVGIAALVSTQVTINLAMHVGLLPITGLALPLVSYGGSSLLATSLALGLALNIGLRPGYEVTNEPFRFAD